jgi:hypothetical protein
MNLDEIVELHVQGMFDYLDENDIKLVSGWFRDAKATIQDFREGVRGRNSW